MEFAVLGPLQVRAAAEAVPIRRGHPRTLLIALLLRSGQTVSADFLIDALWREEMPRNPANALQVLISYLRKVLANPAPDGAALLETRPGGYSLMVERSSIDADRFELLVKELPEVTALRSTEQLGAALGDVDAALALWRGDALEDVADMDFARGAIARLDELRWTAMERRVELLLRLGRNSEAIGDLSGLVQRLPLRERFHEQLVLALYRSGRQGEALRAFDTARKILSEELGLDPGVELRDLERAVLQHDDALDWTPPVSDHAPSSGEPEPESGQVHASPGAPLIRGRVPVPLSPLIGREAEVARLTELLDSHRALTLTGPAGAGKTRLAIALATGRNEPVWYVELSPIDDPALVPAACAAATGVTVTPADDASQAIADTLASQQGLLVLDTCEHLLTAAARLASTVLRAAAGVRVLATSRRALGLRGEFAWPVPPLELPPTDAATADEISSHAAVRLFLDRAHSVRSGLEVDDRMAADVAAICHALDGLPLAIELAAARADVLSPASIRARLANRFELLVDGGVDAVERQQTLRAAIDWSFELLTPDQRTFFARLGVFAGTFDLEAALHVAGEGLPDALDVLASLVKQSMVARSGADRYQLLDTIRAYALDVLADLDADETRTRHARWYTDVAEEGELAIRGPDQLDWLDRLRADVNNFRAALEWSLTTADVDRAARQAGALAWFWTLNGMLTEAIDHLDRLAAVDDVAPEIRSRLLWGYGLLAASLGRLETARDAGYLAADLARAVGDLRQAGYGLNAAAVAEWALGHHDRSLHAHAEAIEALAEIDDQWGLAICKVLQARTLFDRYDPHAPQVAREGVDHARRAGDLHVLGIALTQTAALALAENDPATAIATGSEALELQERIGYTEGAVSALHVLGQAHARDGSVDDARAAHRRALGLASRIGHTAAMCEALEGLARVEATGRPSLAASLLRAARAERESRGIPLRQRDRDELAAFEATLPRGDDDDALRSFVAVVAAFAT